MATMNNDTGGQRGRRRAVLAAPVVMALVVMALLAAACSSSGSPQAGGSSARQHALAVARCMRSHGIPDFPDPNSSGTFTNLSQLKESASQFDAAATTCRNLPDVQEVVYQQALAFVRCMRSHGIPDFPDPGSNGAINSSSVKESDSQLNLAQNACQHLLPPSGGGLPSPAQQQQLLSQALRYSRCMRSHGVPDFPDPAGPIGKNVLRPTGIDTVSPQYQAASNACHALLPGGRTGGRS
jgi:hypothetical protein